MRKYCRAYQLKDLRQFSDWAACCHKDTWNLPDETVCYLCDDLTIIPSPIEDGCVWFSAISPEWQTFCTQTLLFAPPRAIQPPTTILNTELSWTIDPLNTMLPSL